MRKVQGSLRTLLNRRGGGISCKSNKHNGIMASCSIKLIRTPVPVATCWESSAMNSFPNTVANGNGVALASAAVPAAAALNSYPLPGRQEPARTFFNRSATGTAVVPSHPHALARAFARRRKGSAAPSSSRGNIRGCRTAFFSPSAVSWRLTFARARLAVISQRSSLNQPVERGAPHASFARSLCASHPAR